MKSKAIKMLFVLLVVLMTVTAVVADDGFKVSKSMSHEGDGNVSDQELIDPSYLLNDEPLPDNEHAFIGMMKFYVPAQAANGVVAPVDYLNAEEALVTTRELAKPLIGVYINGPVEFVEGLGFVGHGKRDAYGAISLDDGNTWKNTNLSESSDLTSCDAADDSNSCSVYRTDVPLFNDTEGAYPGDVINIFHSIMGNQVLVAWPSRYCASGQPNYSLDTADPSPEQAARRAAIAAYLGIDLSVASPDDLYLVDMFGVGGSQGSVDYTGDKFELNWPVAEVPFSCLWTARGELVNGDDPRTADTIESSFMRWFKAERLTSGARDVNRIETVCVAGAGCAITWQEDPEGLRPGQGEGPGEGWSGAVANSQTDVWYSYIDAEDFNVVQNPADDTGATWMTFADYEAAAVDTSITQKPKPFVPFAMPMRLTDNAKCNVANPQPYCFGSALQATYVDPTPGDTTDQPLNPMAYGLKDMCAATVQIAVGKEGELADVCVTEDGMPLVGNTAATRPRLGLYGYDSNSSSKDKVVNPVINSAFVVVVAEEDKGLGAFGFTADGAACDPDVNPDTCIPFDEGKNIRYFSFSMALTDTVGASTSNDATVLLASTVTQLDTSKDTLLANLTHPGNLLNQPEVNWQTGYMYPAANTAYMWNFTGTAGDFNFDIYNTEIARRGSLLAQDIYKVHSTTSKAIGGLLALPTWKQGTMNQGGPADVMTRRIQIPSKKYDPKKKVEVKTNWNVEEFGNPYAFRNLVCSNWAFADGSNPYYPDGVCLDPAINLSATIPDTCIDSQTGAAVACPQVDLSAGTPYGISDTNPVLQGFVQGEGNTTKVLSWHQCPAGFTVTSISDGTPVYTCDTDMRTDASTLADQSWYNPLDLAKGHRGFLDGDFVMMLYAWSPNWRLNAVGHDRYDLYIRRSFDGANTWTTLPKSFKTWDDVKYSGDGTVSCTSFRSVETGVQEPNEPKICYSYEAGAPEQARNVSQMKSMRITVLDPRFAITGAPQGVSNTSNLFGYGVNPYGEDLRNPSRFFIVYETGDNTTTEFGEPEPQDLFYSRAINFGDEYTVWAEETDLSACYPSNPHENIVPAEYVGSGFCNEFDQLDQGTPGLSASEASLTANPGGQFLYGVWAQWAEDEVTGELLESDAMARRVWWIDGYIPADAWIFGQGSGDGIPAVP